MDIQMTTQEAIVLALVIEAKAVQAEITSMQANDSDPNANKYTEQAYLNLANALHAISGEIQQIARSGVFS